MLCFLTIERGVVGVAVVPIFRLFWRGGPPAEHPFSPNRTAFYAGTCCWLFEKQVPGEKIQEKKQYLSSALCLFAVNRLCCHGCCPPPSPPRLLRHYTGGRDPLLAQHGSKKILMETVNTVSHLKGIKIRDCRHLVRFATLFNVSTTM